jgi:hypothetical protein
MSRQHRTKLTLAAILFSCTALAEQYAGWITDANCAKTGDYMGERHKKEIAADNPIVFVNAADKKIYVVSNPDKVKEAVGKKVSLQGKIKELTIEAEEVTVLEGATGER